jgi:hypothetical protein
MPRTFLITTCALMVLAPALAQQPVAPPVPWANKFFLADIAKDPGQAAPPVIVHDFGTVPQGTLLVHKFTVTNIYDVPVQIIDIRRSCGCLEAEPPQRVLQANEVADFVVTMDTAKFKGPNAPTIQVTFRGAGDDKDYTNTAILRIQANSRAEVTLNPGAAVFGLVAQGAREARTVALEYHGRQRDWKVTGVVPGGPVDVEVTEAARGSRYAVTVKLKPDAPPGPIADVVSLTTNDPAFPVIRVNVTGSVQAPVRVTAAQFGRVTIGREVKVKVNVNSNLGTKYKVFPVEETADGVAVEVLDAPAFTHYLTVRFTPKVAGPFRTEIPIKTDLKGGATATLVVEADVVNPE